MSAARSLIAIDARYLGGPMSGMARYTLNLLRGLAETPASPPVIVLVPDASMLPADVRSSPALRPVRVAGRPGIRDQFGVARRLEAEGVGLLLSLDAWTALADPFDPAALAAAMDRVLSDAPLAETLRRRGMKHAARFTPAAQAAQTRALYERVLREPPA